MNESDKKEKEKLIDGIWKPKTSISLLKCSSNLCGSENYNHISNMAINVQKRLEF